jgi:[protein-PII] uridylyltransferase
MGFPADDVATVTTLVQHHLLLPTIATRRDISDPVTIATVAEAVGDSGTLELLHALALADARAAGPAATSTWRTRLVGDLVRNVGRLLTDGVLPAESAGHRGVPTGPLPAVDIADDAVTVAALDRRGLLAAVAGVLALHRLDVIGADTWTAGDRAVVRVTVAPRFGAAPDRTRLGVDLRLAATGEISADRFARLAAPRPTRATPTEPVVSWHADATDASVVELRAADAPGLLYRVAQALHRCDVDVRAARLATLGGDVVDAFYLAGPWPDPTVRAQVTAAVLAAAT